MAILFDEILLDPDIFVAAGATGGPQYANTHIRNPATAIYKVNVTRLDSQQVWDLQTGLLGAAKLEYFLEFWGGGYGSGYGFRAVIVSDFYVIDEVIGTGNGVQTVFPLTRRYLRPGANHYYTKRIIKPVVNTLLGGSSVTLYEPDGVTPRVIPSRRGSGLAIPAFRVKKDAAIQSSGYVVDNTKGLVTFSAPPASGVISWSGEYDHPVRFLQNSFQLRPDTASDIQGLQLVEILPAELLIT